MNDLMFNADLNLSVSEVAKSVRYNGNNYIGKFMNELLEDTSDEEFRDILNQWIECGVAQMMARGFLLQKDLLNEEIKGLKL